MHRLLLPACALAACLLGGCAAFNRASVTHTRSTTMGQELIDLRKAKDAGLVNDAEYERTRRLILAWGDDGDKDGVETRMKP